MAAEHEKRSEKWRLCRGQYLGEISALYFLHLPSYLSSLPYLLAGTGSQMLVYDLEWGEVIKSFEVFDGIRVHGITCNVIHSVEGASSSSTGLVFEIAIFGERRVKLFNLIVESVLRSGDQPRVCVNLALVHSLPRFSHWVLDVSFLKNYVVASSKEDRHCVAIGCSDNSIRLWDISRSSVILEVQSPERCLLYSMRLWGDNLEALQIASGTIYNEIIVWKVVHQHSAPQLINSSEDGMGLCESFSDSFQLHCRQYKTTRIHRLIGHEGSIFRIAWSPDGSKLVSVSDDRSARIWVVSAKHEGSSNHEKGVVGPVLFGHNARVWDCCIFNSLVVTVGEDCTCRIWEFHGKQLMMIKEHIGRGVWRCLCDPSSSLLITAGFDSAIKVHQLPASLTQRLEGQSELKPFIHSTEIFATQIPNSCEHNSLMDSKSEYVRCLLFTSKDTLYVTTNNGYLYHAKVFETHDVKWTRLVQVSEEVPIICMDFLSQNSPKHSCGVDDWIALGDGKGNMTIVRVKGETFTPEVNLTFTWSAGKERQLLGTHWCKALGYRFIFTTDHRGTVKLWRLLDPLPSLSHTSASKFDVSLVAEFISCVGIRIICLDASFEDELLICGDLRGNLILFPLSRNLLLETPAKPEMKISPITYFKGAHGISTVSSMSVTKLSFNEIEIRTTGGDGCVCYFEYDRNQQSVEFIGMKQLKELSLIQSVSIGNDSPEDFTSCGYAVGFASTDFIIWNLKTEAKVVQIPCGGWRRPNSYYLGDVPEMMNCFAFVKDEVIYFHRQWVPENERKTLPQNLHIQFHGREMHSLCFVSDNSLIEADRKPDHLDKFSWIATGCEDGTVRLTRFTPGVKNSFTSKLLGEHVGGSAVRSISCVSKVHMISSDVINLSDWSNGQNNAAQDRVNPVLLISVGAKRVLTSWLLRHRSLDDKELLLSGQEQNKSTNEFKHSLGGSSSLSFKWLTTDMPTKNSSARSKYKDIEKTGGITENVSCMKDNANSESLVIENEETESKTSLNENYEDDLRFMAVTAFLVKCTGSRLTICFVAVACSDATLALRALVLPHRLWFDVASLIPLSSPVLALQHVVIPMHLPSEENIQIRNAYVVISGTTDGSLALWDLTESVEAFMQQLSTVDVVNFINCQTRPRTGRGSQGGRWWRSLSSRMSKKRPGDGSVALKAGEKANAASTANNAESCCPTVYSQAMHNASVKQDVDGVGSSSEMCEICPLLVLHGVHQSGVNCIHVSDIRDCQSSGNGFLFTVISGGDDQALHCLEFDFLLSPTCWNSEIVAPEVINLATKCKTGQNSMHWCQNQTREYRIRCLCHDRIASAHSSAIKGVWTDGIWVFSTGLDQRIRCWLLEDHCKLTEQAHLIISVPEPEALQVRACGRKQYEIVVAGRGMQMVEFCAS